LSSVSCPSHKSKPCTETKDGVMNVSQSSVEWVGMVAHLIAGQDLQL